MEKQAFGFIVAPEQGPVWEMEPGRPTTFKLLSDQTGESVAVFEEVVPPGGGTPLHIHPTSDEVIYILAGEFTFKIGEQVAKGCAGSYVFIPRGSVHGWRNTGSEVGNAIFTFTPAGGAKFFEAMRLLDIPVTSLDPATLEDFCRQYNYIFVTFDW